MSATIEEFINGTGQGAGDERHAMPWPTEPDGDGAPASELYARFKAEWTGEGRCPNITEFGVWLKDHGFEKREVESGHVYPALTVATRWERATESIQYVLREEERPAIARLMQAEHDERKHPDGSECEHELPEAELDARTEFSVTHHRSFWNMFNNQFGPYIHVWRPGEPDPTYPEAVKMAWLRHDRGKLVAEHKSLTAQLAELRDGIGDEPVRYGRRSSFGGALGRAISGAVAEPTPELAAAYAEQDEAQAQLDAARPTFEAAREAAQERVRVRGGNHTDEHEFDDDAEYQTAKAAWAKVAVLHKAKTDAVAEAEREANRLWQEWRDRCDAANRLERDQLGPVERALVANAEGQEAYRRREREAKVAALPVAEAADEW